MQTYVLKDNVWTIHDLQIGNFWFENYTINYFDLSFFNSFAVWCVHICVTAVTQKSRWKCCRNLKDFTILFSKITYEFHIIKWTTCELYVLKRVFFAWPSMQRTIAKQTRSLPTAPNLWLVLWKLPAKDEKKKRRNQTWIWSVGRESYNTDRRITRILCHWRWHYLAKHWLVKLMFLLWICTYYPLNVYVTHLSWSFACCEIPKTVQTCLSSQLRYKNMTQK